MYSAAHTLHLSWYKMFSVVQSLCPFIGYVLPVSVALKLVEGGCIGHVLHLGLPQGYEPAGSLVGLVSCEMVMSLFTIKLDKLGGLRNWTLGMFLAKSAVLLEASRIGKPDFMMPFNA